MKLPEYAYVVSDRVSLFAMVASLRGFNWRRALRRSV